MKDLFFKYGNGKSTDLCQAAYNYVKNGANIIVMNADHNKPIELHVEKQGRSIETRDVIHSVSHIFESGFSIKEKGVVAVLVDNAHMLSPNQAAELFYLCKTFDIPVLAYGNRTDRNGKTSPGALRLMELADIIEPIDCSELSNSKSRIRFYYGAMNATKTTKLLFLARALEENGKRVMTVKPLRDRSETMITCRVGLARKADVVLGETDRILGPDYSQDKHGITRRKVDAILVDEAQFLTIDQIDELKSISDEFNIPVGCFGLKTDFTTKSFSGSSRLLGIAELSKLRTTCSCKGAPGADFNARKENGQFTTKGDSVVIDDGKSVEYESLCARCYIEKVQGIDLGDPVKVLKRLENDGIIRL